MPGTIHLLFSHTPEAPTAGEFASLLDDIEAAYRVAFWTNRLRGFEYSEITFPESPEAIPVWRQDYVEAFPTAWVPLPAPPTMSELELRTEKLSFQSPFEFFGTVPGIVTAAGGTGTILWLMAKHLEDLFDMPGRIRMRRIRRNRQRYEEMLARDEAADRYFEARRRRSRLFKLEEGEVEDDEG